jgi:hypothetical protein
MFKLKSDNKLLEKELACLADEEISLRNEK